MNLEWSAGAQAFRDHLRAWLEKNLDPDWRSKSATKQGYLTAQSEWDRRLHAGGWSGIWWPREYGGTDASLEERAVFALETATRGAPDGLASLGRIFIGPGIMRYGSKEQRATLLAPILTGEHVWCQGFSEPEAGSDLASLRTRALRDGNHYRVDGSKIWTTRGQFATHCLLLARTDPKAPKHKGITAFVMPVPSPGLTVRPMHQINNRTDFNQLFLDDVKIPASNRLGSEGQGWEVALHVLGHERGAAMALRGIANMQVAQRSWLSTLQSEIPSAAFVRSALETAVAQLLAFKIVSDDGGGSGAGNQGPIAKLFWTEAWQRQTDAAMLEAGGLADALHSNEQYAEDLVSVWLDSRRSTISGGTAEIQRNLIATRVLGLPK